MRIAATLLTSSLTLLLVACTDPDAPEKCDDLVDAICENTAETCGRPVTVEECLEVVADAGFDCDHAVRVSSTYDECLEIVEEMDACLVLEEELSEECEDSILVAE